ncbi:hypothetical protein GCM10027592_03390 [Spirosoma flavus]
MFDFDYFNKLGLNLYTASHVLNSFNSNESNILKSPNIYWDEYKVRKQTSKDVDFLKEQESCGFGIVLGFNDIYSLDIDGYLDENLICNLLYILGLPLDYEWVIKSGSGIGFHIIFICSDLKTYEKKTIAYFAREHNRDFGKIEFKFEGNSILPMSLHETGNYYSFYNKFPKYIPREVSFDALKLIELHYCSYQTAYSQYGEYDFNEPDYDPTMKIDFIAPVDNDLDFIFTHVLRKRKFLVFSWHVKEINTTNFLNKKLYLVQLSLLMLDNNFNIVLRKNYNYVDNVNSYGKVDDFISLDISNKIISGNKSAILQEISTYIELVNSIVIFDEKEIDTVRSEINNITSKRHSNLKYLNNYGSHRHREDHKLVTFSTPEFTELNYFFEKKFNRRISSNSSLIKAYYLYYLLLDKEKIPFKSDKITQNELWETKTLHNLLTGEKEDFFKNNIDHIKAYLKENYGYKSGSINSFIENKDSNFPGNFDDLINIVKDIKLQKRKEAQERIDYLEELRANYDPSEDKSYDRSRELERDNFDALTDGQYGSFERFNGDYDSLRDSMGL